MAKASTSGSAARKPAKKRKSVAKKTAPPAKAERRTVPEKQTPAKAERRAPVKLTPAERDRRFNVLLQTACLKAGSAAAIRAITGRVPLLGRLAPTLLGSVAETAALGRIHQQLVRDTLDLYDLELSELEERGVILLATAGGLGAQTLSRQMVDQIVKNLGGRYLRPIATRALPLATLVTDIAAAIAGTYAVGKRAQALCTLPGTGARNLSELLRGLTGIDQRRLFSWSAEALALALKPVRGALSLIPGLR